ncbi:MAG TPA: SPOR domain-containing protein [Thermoleophilaceae bacterium]
MSTTTQANCATCDAPLAEDQRYCLECGARRNGARLPFTETGARPAPAAEPPPPPPPPDRPLQAITPSMAAAGVALAVLFLGVGVLIGRSGSGAEQTAAKPTIVRVGDAGSSATSGTAQQASNTTVKGDWPAGKAGWTVQLQALRKDDPAKITAAKQDAKDKGAPDVGLIDTDSFESLPAGNYIVYSGQFDSKAKAAAALSKLKKDFPKAKVIHVGASAPAIGGAKAQADKQAVQNLDNLSGSDYAKQSRKLPDTLALPGKPPPKDNKEGGGGTGFETIN